MPSGQLPVVPLSGIHFGTIDAKNEFFLEPETFSQLVFLTSVNVPLGISNSDFGIGGEPRKFIFHGTKGTGKTSLLNYFRFLASKSDDVKTHFILYENSLNQMTNAASRETKEIAEIVKKNAILGTASEYSAEYFKYEFAWRLYFYQLVYSIIENENLQLFEKDENFEEFHRLLYVFFENFSSPLKSTTAGISQLFPKPVDGSIKVKTKFTEIIVNFIWKNKTFSVSIFDLVRRLDDCFACLKGTGKRVYIYIDELEVSLADNHQREIDFAVIRDLIISLMHINHISSNTHKGVFVFTGIRTEISDQISSKDKEISRIIDDFGVLLNWYLPDGVSGRNIHNPLIRIIGERIFISKVIREYHENPKHLTDVLMKMGWISEEKNRQFVDLYNNIKSRITDAHTQSAWDEVFQNTLKFSKANRISTKSYIIERTWSRPRDIVRMMKLIKEKFPEATYIEAEHFRGIETKYAQESWEEIQLDLLPKYDIATIGKISDVLCNFKQKFNFEEFSARVYDYFDTDEINVKSILKSLYESGVVGFCKTDNRKYFFYKGNPAIDFNAELVIHEGLIPYFIA